MRPLLLCCLSALVLASCATPNVNTPSLSEEEIRRERAAQEQINKLGLGEITARETAYYLEQLQRVAPRIQKAGVEVCQSIGHKNCEFGFKLVEESGISAYADGKDIHITTGMMAFADNDDAIANVLAHEYAHNVLAHVASTQRNVTIGAIGGSIAQQALESQGIQIGNISDLGAQMAQMRYSKAFEQEADHVGLYISKRAGYNLDSMPDIWRRMAAADSRGIYTASTHPTYPERYIGMQQTINEIRGKEQNGQPLVPSFREQKKYF